MRRVLLTLIGCLLMSTNMVLAGDDGPLCWESFPGGYLEGWAEGGWAHSDWPEYDTLEEAQIRCVELGDQCGGVTSYQVSSKSKSKTKVYTCRAGKEFNPEPAPNSWLKKTCNWQMAPVRVPGLEEQNVFLPFSSNDQWIEITTNSEDGSGEKLEIYYYLEENSDAFLGSFTLAFGSEGIEYWSKDCFVWTTLNPQPAPTESEPAKTWRIKKVGETIMVYCNDVLVLNDRCEGNEGWSTGSKFVKFSNTHDTASEMYRIVQL